MKKLIHLSVLLFCVAGCKIEEDKFINIGKCRSARVIPTSFNENIKMEVETDKGFYILIGAHSFKKNKEININERYVYKETK